MSPHIVDIIVLEVFPIDRQFDVDALAGSMAKGWVVSRCIHD